MAEVFKPYQSIGERFQKTQMPQGLALQEGRRTMAVLSQSMDRMTNFALGQMETKAKIEGAEFGVENAPSLKMLQDANAENTDAFEQFDTSTVFGRAAKDAAITVLENDVYVTATEHINDLVFQATVNGTEPSVLRDSLDSAIMGYEGILRPTAPGLAKKLTARLGLSAASQFSAYQKASISDTTSAINSGHILTINTLKENVGSYLDALFENNQLNEEQIVSLEAKFSTELTRIPGVYTGAKVISEIADWNKQVDSWAESKILNYAIGTKNALIVGDKVVAGKSLDNTEIDNILKLGKLNNAEFREKVADRIRKNVRAKREENQANENNEGDSNTELGKSRQVLFLNLVKGPMNEEQYQQALSYIDDVDKMLTIEKGDKLRAMLNDVRLLNDGTRRAVTDTSDTRVVQVLNKVAENTLTFEELATVQHFLDGDDFEKAVNSIEKQFDTDHKQAVTILKQLGYDPAANTLEDKSDKFYKIAKNLYNKGLQKLDEEIARAKFENRDVDLQGIARKFVEEQGALLVDESNKIIIANQENNIKVIVEQLSSSPELIAELGFDDNKLENLKRLRTYLIANKGNDKKLRALKGLGINKNTVQRTIIRYAKIIETLEELQ
tara:strand:+ start:657 stop:2498 length:1842 start_codon:yes stop_codon:yes gene_type:complete